MIRQLLTLFITIIVIRFIGTSADEPERIVIGESIHDIREYPFLALLRENGSHVCTGVILSEYHVLLPAHCLLNVNVTFETAPSLFKVSTGKSHVENNFYNISRMTYHHDYIQENQTSPTYDIGLIKLANPIKFNEYQKKINLPDSDPLIDPIGHNVNWNPTDFKDPDWPDVVLQTDMTILSSNICKKIIKINPADGLFCAYSPFVYGSCELRDGPLVRNNQLIGIVSNYYPPCAGHPNLYVNVYHYAHYIMETMNEM